MRVSLPDDPDGTWRASLTDWQRRTLAVVASGEYHQWRAQTRSREQHRRIAVRRTTTGFLILGLAPATTDGFVNEQGVPIIDRSELPSLWRVVWVDQCEERSTLLGGEPREPYLKTGRPGGHADGYQFEPSVRRRGRRRDRRARKRAEREAAERARYETGLAAHIAAGFSPFTYQGPDA